MSDNNEKPENNEIPETPAEAEPTAESTVEAQADAAPTEAQAETAPVGEGESASADAPEVIPEPEPESSEPTAPKAEETFVYWPVEKDHGSVTRMLTAEAQDVDLSVKIKGGSFVNFFLMLLIIGAAGAGIWQLSIVSSAEALEAKRQEREAAEKAHMEEMLKKQKKYGVLRIESVPDQAIVVKDNEKIMVTKTQPAAAAGADGKPAEGDAANPAAAAPAAAPAAAGAAGAAVNRAGTTPMNLMNMDVKQVYKFRIDKPGYESYEFSVAEHLWTKDSSSGEYKYYKLVELNPVNCEYWHLYDAKLRKELKFRDLTEKEIEAFKKAAAKAKKKAKKKKKKKKGKKDAQSDVLKIPTGKSECQAHYDKAIINRISVTECACKIPEEAPEDEKKDANKAK